jgi:cytochrome P450
MSDGATWERQRSLVEPAFSGDRIVAYTGVMVDEATRLAERWTDGDRYDVFEQMRRVTLRVLVRALFGSDLGDLEDRLIAAFTDFSAKFAQPFYVPDWIPTPTNRRYKRAVEEFDEVIYELIDRQDTDKTSDDLLSRMMTAETDDGTRMGRTQIRDEIMTLLFAGHKTTALLLSFVWYLLTEHPQVERRLHEAVVSRLAGPTPTPAELTDLAYLKRIIKETLRLYPPVHMMTRETTEPVTMGGYVLPEGATVNLSQWVVHRDERFYDDPESFRPDRWTTDFESSLPRYAYFPFGGGPRQCLGLRFAQIEAQALVATLARQFRLVRGPDTSLDLSASGETLDPDGGIELIVRERS